MAVESVEKSGRAEVLALYTGYLVKQGDVAGSTNVAGSTTVSDAFIKIFQTCGLDKLSEAPVIITFLNYCHESGGTPRVKPTLSEILEIKLVDRIVFEHCFKLAAGTDREYTEQLFNRIFDVLSVARADAIWDRFEVCKVADGDIVGAARVRWRADGRT